MIAQLTELVPLVDKAAEASNRWLFLASLVILMIVGGAVIRWLVKSLEAQNLTHADERNLLREELTSDRAECRVVRKGDQEAFLATLEKKDSIMGAHTKAFESLAAIVVKHDAEMRMVHQEKLREIIRAEMRAETGTSK